MENNSRIRFNPVTKEIEIEGSEAFVKTYFGKVQAIISGSLKKDEKKPKTVRVIPNEKARKTSRETKPNVAQVEKTAAGKLDKKKVTNISSIVRLIQASNNGISTAELKGKTGLSERQIWSIVDRAAKEGKIKKIRRGLYGGVAENQE